MNKGVLYIFLSFLGLTVLANPDNNASPQTQLHPEITRIFSVSQDQDLILENNILPGLLGIYATNNSNFMEAGKTLFLDIMDRMKKIQQTPSYSFSLAIFQFRKKYIQNPHYNLLKNTMSSVNNKKRLVFCDFRSIFNSPSCIDEKMIIARLVNEAIIRENTVLLVRYQSLQKLSEYIAPFGFSVHSFTDNISQSIEFLSALRLMQAVYLIQDGFIKEAFTILHQEKKFLEKIARHNTRLTSHEARLISTSLKTIDQYFSWLLDKQSFQPYLNHPDIAEFLKPVPQNIENLLGKALYHEYTVITPLRMFYDLNHSDTETGERHDWKNKQAAKDINASINFHYDLFSTYIQQFSLMVLPESRVFYMNDVLNDQVTQWKNNHYHKWILKYQNKNHILYTTKFRYTNLLAQVTRYQYELMVLHALVKVKYKIKQAGIADHEIEDFILSLKEEAMNPYTLNPFVWDKHTRTLYTELVDYSYRQSSQQSGFQKVYRIVLSIP